jgi:hypothetical protein
VSAVETGGLENLPQGYLQPTDFEAKTLQPNRFQPVVLTIS